MIGKLLKIFQDFLRAHHIGVFLIHIKEIDGVTHFPSIKNTVLHNDHMEPEREGV